LIHPEAMLTTKNQPIYHSTLIKVKFIKIITKIIEILTKFLQIELLKIFNPTTANIPIGPIMINPHFTKIKTLFLLTPDLLKQEFFKQQYHNPSKSL
jgi:hypothetical protein